VLLLSVKIVDQRWFTRHYRDNLDYAAAGGVTTAVELGGSIRTAEVHAAAAELGVRHLTTAQRLFHH
jgi:phosphoribosylaminoimidazolecarboxamide formyltransferase / IMP cyclohydrolase